MQLIGTEMNSNEFDDNHILDRLKSECGFLVDASAGEAIGLSRQNLSHVRRGRRDLPVRSKLVALHLLGYTWAKEAANALFPDSIR